ncbi:MAG: cation diffusion facilitator family transporter [Candidatus Baldrarchaeia archaeon]
MIESYAEAGKKAAIISAWGNAILSMMKITIGILSGSVGLLTDGFHSLVDVVSSVMVWVGIKISAKPPDKTHPYGHYKAENIASLFVSLFIIGAGVETAWESIKKIFLPEEIFVTYITFIIPLIAAIGSLILAEYKRRVGERINSPSLIAEGVHSRVDSLASATVFFGILFSSYGILIADPLIGFLISLAIIREGYNIGKDSIYTLMDTLLEQEVLNKIKQLAREVPGVMEVSEVRARSAGGHIFVDLEIELSPTLDITRADVIRKEVIKKIKHEISKVDHVFIAIKPVEREEIVVAIPSKSPEGLKSEVCEHFGRAEYLTIVVLGADKKIKEIFIERNPFIEEEKGKGVSLAESLFKRGVSIVIVRNIGRAAFSVLKSYGIQILKTKDEKTVNDVIFAFRNRKMEEAVLTSHEEQDHV